MLRLIGIVLLFSIVVSIPVITPYFNEGYFPTHDGEWAVVRAGEMFRELRDFQIPPRFSSALNFGYGYPLFNFAYPMPYYLSVILNLLGFGFVGSIKLLFASSVVLSAFFMFLASNQFFKSKIAGLISSILYVYLPYRMVDLFVRGSLGESMALVLFPLLFYLILKFSESRNNIYLALGSLTFAALILTHNIMAILFLPILFAFLVTDSIVNKYKILPYAAFLIAGAMLSSYFWLPALWEKNLILLSQTPIADRNLYFVSLEELILPSWGYGTPTDPDAFSYQLGLAHITVVLMLIAFLLVNFKKKNREQVTTAALTLLLFALTFFLFPFTSFVWENTPLIKEINYPWTLLGPLGFLLAFLSGYLYKSKKLKYIALAISFLGIIYALPYAKPKEHVYRNDDLYLTNEATTTSSDEYMPLWVREKPTSRWSEKAEIARGDGEIINLKYNSKRISFDSRASQDIVVKINTIYYPGWEFRTGTQNLKVKTTQDTGVMEVLIPRGEHSIQGLFKETPLRLAADIISLLTLFILLLYLLLKIPRIRISL